jgi:hypothetical protein
MTEAPVTFDPDTMDPATAVPIRVECGAGEPLHARMPYWEIGALLAILRSRIDAVRAVGAQKFLEGAASPQPENLTEAASLIHEAARRCRQARWDSAVPTLDPRMYFSSTTVNHETTTHLGITSYLLEADAAAMRGIVDPKRWERLGGRAVQQMLQDLILLAWRHPNVPPAVEADLAQRGFTAAEYLVTRAARLVCELATLYRAAEPAAAIQFHRIARDATVLAHGAQKTIEEGVRHTLRTRPVAE